MADVILRMYDLDEVMSHVKTWEKAISAEAERHIWALNLVWKKIRNRVWTPPPYPMGAPRGPHPHPPWGWGIDFEKPRGWGILTQTPRGFGGVFDAFLCFSDRKISYFYLFLRKKPDFFQLENLIAHFAKKSFKQPPFPFINYPYSQQCGGGRGRFSTKNLIRTSKIK